MNDVLIAGGGLVGMAAGLALQQAGFGVQMVDQGQPPPAPEALPDDPRVYALSPATLKFLTALGVDLPATQRGHYTRMEVWESTPEQALQLSASSPQQDMGAIVEHRHLAHALWQAAAVLPSRWGSRIAQLTAEEGLATAALEEGSTLSAKLALICDGPRSPLRAQLAVPVAQRAYGQQAIIATLHSTLPHRGVAWQRFLPSGPLALLPRAHGLLALVWSCDEDFADALLALDAEAFCQQLNAATQDVLGTLTLSSSRKAIPLHLQHPEEICGEGFVLAGDAAHVIHPLAGQGLNLGFADVRALAAVLGEARAAGRGWWRTRTLSAYARSRKAETREMMVVTDGLQRLFGSQQAWLLMLRRFGLQQVQRAAPLKDWLTVQATRA